MRKADTNDVARLVELINDAYAIERTFKTGERIASEELPPLMERGVFLVHEDASKKIVATVYVRNNGDRAYFGFLAVDPSAQGTGIGRNLIASAENLARDWGCSIMDIHVLSLRPELPPFYRRLGYVETGVEEFGGEGLLEPCHVIVMSKPLH